MHTPLLFLLPLAIGLLSGYICLNSDEEITYLTAVISLICFLISLALAPWPVLLGLLMFVLITAKKQLLNCNRPIQFTENQVFENIKQQN